jgi:hypothetical protein
MIVSSPPKFFAGTVVLGGTPAEFNMQGYASGSIANTSSGGLLDILLVKAGSGETQKMRLIAGTALNFVNLALSQITISVSSESSINEVNFQILYYTKNPETDYEVMSLEAASSMWLSTIGLGASSSVDIASPLDGDRVAVAAQEDITEFTSVPFNVPANGRIVFQVAGTGATASISFNNDTTTYSLNSGSTLANGAIYEFSVAVAAGDAFTVSGATFIRGFFISGVMA